MYTGLHEWYHTPLGCLALAAEQYELEKVLPNYFGYHLLQVDGPALDWLQGSPIKHHVRYSQSTLPNDRITSVYGYLNNVPFMPESIDVVIIPHILEFIDSPKHLLEEVAEITIADGHCIIIGFNPLSLWGFGWLLNHKSRVMPWHGKFHRMGLVRHWLEEVGFEIEILKTFFYRPPIHDLQHNKMKIFEAIGQSCWPWLGGLYMITARKVVKGLRPIKLRCRQIKYIPGKNIATSGSMERDKAC